MQALGSRHACHAGTAVVRQTRHDCVGRMLAYMRCEGRLVTGVEFEGAQVIEAVCGNHRGCDPGFCIREADAVVAALGQQARDERTDLARAQYKHFLHLTTRASVCRHKKIAVLADARALCQAPGRLSTPLGGPPAAHHRGRKETRADGSRRPVRSSQKWRLSC